MPSIQIDKYSAPRTTPILFLKRFDFFSALRIIVGFLFVFSVVFVPYVSFLQSYVVTIGTGLVGLALVFGILFQKDIALPRAPVMYALVAFLGAVIISAILGPNAKALSLIGFGGELDTVIFVATWVILIIAVSAITTSAHAVFSFLKIITLSSIALVLLFTIQEIFFAQKFFMQIPAMTAGIFSLVLLTISLFMRHYFIYQKQKGERFVNSGTFTMVLLSLVGLFLAHSFVMWILAGLVVLGMIAYALMYKMEHAHAPIPWFTGAVFLMLLGAIFLGGLQQNWQERKSLEITQVSSVTSTLHVTRSALAEYPLFGTGPNSFATLWDSQKPALDVMSQDAHITRMFGFGYFPTFIATTGLLGLVTIVSFIVLFMLLAMRVISHMVRTPKDEPLDLIVWLLAVLLVIVNIVSFGGLSVLVLTAIVLGMAFASGMSRGYMTKYVPEITFKGIRFSKLLAALVLVIILLVIMLYVTGHSMFAFAKFKSAFTGNQTPIEKIQDIEYATKWRSYDGYYRALSNAYLGLFLENIQQETLDEEGAKFLVSKVLYSAQQAIEYNRLNYLNYLHMGNSYRQLGLLDIPQASDEALRAYDIALERKPLSIDVLLAKAQVYLDSEQFDRAEQVLNQAYVVNQNRVDVYITAARLAFARNNQDQAVNLLMKAAQLDANNHARWFDLGVALFAQKKYEFAAQSFNRAITLYPLQESYYYLGLALRELGRSEDVQKIYTLLKDGGSTLPIENLLQASTVPAPQEELPNTETEDIIIEEAL
jgi:tetratricopeptide (TPR) repeat protein